MVVVIVNNSQTQVQLQRKNTIYIELVLYTPYSGQLLTQTLPYSVIYTLSPSAVLCYECESFWLQSKSSGTWRKMHLQHNNMCVQKHLLYQRSFSIFPNGSGRFKCAMKDTPKRDSTFYPQCKSSSTMLIQLSGIVYRCKVVVAQWNEICVNACHNVGHFSFQPM